jgi:hypothetical protein
MTDPNAGWTGANPGEQTIPLVPDAGYPQPDLQPLPEETLVDPLDPWASGPGLGQSSVRQPPATQPTQPVPSVATQPTQPLPFVPAQPTEPLPTLAMPPLTAAAPAAPSAVAHDPAPQPAGSGYRSPADYPRTAPAAVWTPPPTVAPRPPAAPYAQPPYAGYPEPSGPAATIDALPTYAASGYQGQSWQPAIVDPVAYDYGYRGTPTSPHPNAVISMVLGIIGIVAFSPLAPIAWYLAAKGRREMSYDPGRWSASGMLTAGFVLGIIGTVLLGLGIAFFLFVFAMMASFGP